MKPLLKLLTLVLLIALLPATNARVIGDPSSWTYEVKKLKNNEYALIFHLKLKPTWHIWSVNPGGDGLQIAPSFSFDTDKGVKLNGRIREQGKKITGMVEGIDGKVSYYKNRVDYEQRVTVTGPARITGRLKYQLCNDNMCLPPKKTDFAFEIK